MTTMVPQKQSNNSSDILKVNLTPSIFKHCESFIKPPDAYYDKYVSYNTSDDLETSDGKVRLNAAGTRLVKRSNKNHGRLIWNGDYTDITGMTDTLCASLKLDDKNKQWDFKNKLNPETLGEKIYAFCNGLFQEYANSINVTNFESLKPKEASFNINQGSQNKFEHTRPETAPSKNSQDAGSKLEFIKKVRTKLNLSEDDVGKIENGMPKALNLLQSYFAGLNFSFIPDCTKTGTKDDAIKACKKMFLPK